MSHSYHSDSESCVMTSGNSPFISKEARYNFLTRSGNFSLLFLSLSGRFGDVSISSGNKKEILSCWERRNLHARPSIFKSPFFFFQPISDLSPHPLSHMQQGERRFLLTTVDLYYVTGVVKKGRHHISEISGKI